jgi:hypothetical protein
MVYDGITVPISEDRKETTTFEIYLYEIAPKGLSVTGVEAKFIFKDLETIKRWLGADEMQWNWGMKAVKTSKAKSPSFKVYSKLGSDHREVIVHPKENYYTDTEFRVHYICQHIFGSFPYAVNNLIYDYRTSSIVIGVLHTLAGQNIEFTCGDIKTGFLTLDQKTIDEKYGDSFSRWILSRHPAL